MAAAQPPPPAAAAALPPLVALEVSNIPPQATHSELASIFSQFCALEEVLTVFKHGSSGGGSDSDGGGCALVLLPAAADAQESAAMAAEILNDYPLQGSLLGVQLCDSPAEWLRRSVNPQLISCLEQLLAPPPAAPPAAPAVQPPTPRRQQQQNGTEPADGLLWSAASGEASGGYPPSDAGDSSGGGLTPRSAAGGGGGGAAGPGSFAGWETSATCVVVMNIDPRLSAREIGEYFLQFGEVEECRKPQGKRYAFVQFVDAAGAARARQALHDAWIPELNQQGPVHVQPRRRRGRGNDQWQDSRPRPEQQAASSERQLFVNNLGLDISREAVGHHFEQFGAIESVRKLPHWQYAFVTYARPEDAAAAIEQAHGVPVPELNPLQGAPIKVQYSLGPGAKNGSGSGSSEGSGRATHSSREARGGTVSGGSGGGGWDSGAAGGGSGDAAEHW